MRLLIALWSVSNLIIASIANGKEPDANASICIVAFGDSTTAKRGNLKIYCDQLQDTFDAAKRDVEIINAGVGGNHTDLAMKRFDRDVLKHAPDIVIIQFGINDSAIDVWRTPPATQPRIAIEQYSNNLNKFVDALQTRKARVILMTPNPLRWTDKLNSLYGKPPYDANIIDGFNVLLKEYSAAVRQIAKKQNVALIDVDQEFRKFDQQPEQSMDQLLLDGMHPNERGHQLISELLLPELNREIARRKSAR